MKFNTIMFSTTVLCTSLAGTAAPALAQESDSGQVADIVVTARKTSENIQKTPVAVTAVTPEAIITKQINTVSDLTRTTPSFAAIGGGISVATIGNYSIRGQAQANMGSSNDTPVGMYIDGVYYSRSQANNGAMIDIASAEVLRGPQGTLFGRNTTGGALNITSQAPTQDFEGFIRAGAGNYSQAKIEGAVNTPLSDEVAIRFAGSYERHDGYYYNNATNRRMGDMDNYFGRASLKWAPKDKPITVRIVGDYSLYNDNGVASKTASFINPTPFRSPNPAAVGATILAQPTGFYTTYSGVVAAGSYVNTVLGVPAGTGASGNPEIDTPHSRALSRGVLGQLDWDIGDVTLKSITAYRQNHSNSQWDLDTTYTAIPANFAFASEYFQKQFSQELQLSGKIGQLDLMTGAFFFRESGSERSDAGQAGLFSRDLTDFTSRSIGLFAQGTYHFSDKFRATGGFRYTWDQRTASLQGTYATVSPTMVDANTRCGVGPDVTKKLTDLAAASKVCRDYQVAKFSYPAWLASIDYQFNPDLFGYVKTSGASMAGGINFRFAPAQYLRFQPEEVRDIEVGLKADFLDRHLRTNLAAYHIWRSGLQANVTDTAVARGSSQYQINAGRAHQYGVELEVTAIPWNGMEINGAFAYEKSRYVSGTYRLFTGTSFIDRSADAVPQAPNYTWSLGATQKIPVNNLGEFSIHSDYSFISTFYQYPNSTNAAINRAGAIPGRGLLNGRIALKLDRPNVELAVWGRNLTKKEYISSVFNGLYAAYGVAAFNPGSPRTWGGTVSFNW